MVVFEISRCLRRRLDRDYYRFRGWRLAPFCLTAQWNEWICLGKVSGGTALRNVVRHDNKPIRVTFAILEMTGQIDDLARVQALLGNVTWIHKDDTPFALDPAVSVAEIVDRRVELIVRPDRREQKLIFLQVKFFQYAGSEMCLSGFR